MEVKIFKGGKVRDYKNCCINMNYYFLSTFLNWYVVYFGFKLRDGVFLGI